MTTSFIDSVAGIRGRTCKRALVPRGGLRDIPAHGYPAQGEGRIGPRWKRLRALSGIPL